jgi:peptidoglycan/LPS O-acetylase OafA/YrhL
MVAGLDGIRGVAVLLVLLFHARLFSAGWIGVPVFFVLSGYLITGILLRQKDAPLREYLRSFYGRRALRIFPAYFAFLVVVAVVSVVDRSAEARALRSDLPWAFTYTFDFFTATRAGHAHLSEITSHLWSLSVEEQFYLIWPLVVFAAPRRAIRGLLASLVIAGPLLRALTMVVWHRLPFAATDRLWFVYVLPTSHLDAFATGALLNLRQPRISVRAFGSACAVMLGACLVVRGAYRDGLLPLGLPHAYAYVWGYSLLNLTSAAFILLVARGQIGRKVLRRGLLPALGRISYGVYLLHYPLDHVVAPFVREHFRAGLPAGTATFVMDLVLTVALAAASHRWLERPFLVLKERWFPVTERIPGSLRPPVLPEPLEPLEPDSPVALAPPSASSLP